MVKAQSPSSFYHLLALSRKVLHPSEPQFLLLRMGRMIGQLHRVWGEGSLLLCTGGYQRRPGCSPLKGLKGLSKESIWEGGFQKGFPPFPDERGSRCPHYAPTVWFLLNTGFLPAKFGTCGAESPWVASPSKDLRHWVPAPWLVFGSRSLKYEFPS